VDVTVGDRRSGCRDVMEPIAVWVKNDGEWALVHRCRRCGKVNTNRIAGDDDESALMELAHRPLAARTYGKVPDSVMERCLTPYRYPRSGGRR
jgi:hypothetical protein